MKHLKRLFVPLPQEIITYVVISLFIIATSLLPLIVTFITGPEETVILNSLLKERVTAFLTSFSQVDIFATLATNGFLLFVFSLLFVALWIVGIGFTSVLRQHSMASEATALHPSITSLMRHNIAAVILRICLAILIIAVTLYTTKNILPVAQHTFQELVLNWASIVAWLGASFALFLLVAVMHLYAILFRLFFGRERVFEEV